jgi:hypothetical protein
MTTHRIREVCAADKAKKTKARTITRCGIEIPEKDVPLFSLSVWVPDVDCLDCLSFLRDRVLVHHSALTNEGFEVQSSEVKYLVRVPLQ